MKSLKIALLISLFCLIYNQAAAQINLVQNGSFEDYIVCPSNKGEVENCVGWYSASNTPDYFNECAPKLSGNGVSIPANGFGFQKAYYGKAYMGTATFGSDDYREYLRGSLSQALTVGIKYFISLRVSLAERTTKYSSNKIGVLFTNQQYESLSNPAPMPSNYAHVYTNNIVTDTFGWTLINGSFIADSSYSYIMIGNFFDDHNTNVLTSLDSNSPEASYYYIDDVCVSKDSTLCGVNSSGCDFALPSAFTPNGDNINDEYKWVHNCNNIESFSMRIYNRWGELVFDTNDFSVGWDGKYKNEPQPRDVYLVYVLVVAQGKQVTKSASISLLR